jgi:hypothetical protein
MFGAALSLLLLDKELFAAAEELVDDVERQVEEQTGQRLEEVEGSIKIRQRRSIGFGVIAHTAFKRYPKRNPVRLRDLLGPLLLGHLFDTVGRRTMITLCYTLSGVLLIGTGLLFNAGTLSATTLTACWVVVFFFASAGASAAYLTGSEIFPMETGPWPWPSSTPSAPASAGSPGRPCSPSWSRPARRSTSSTATCSGRR